MKVKFSHEVPFTPLWNGNRDLPEAEQIKTTIKPMQVGDLLLVMDAMGKKAGQPDADAPLDIGRLINEAGNILPKYVTMTGLEDDHGPVSITQLLSFGAYIPLASELLMECARVSMPSETTEGNSQQPSA